MGDVTFFGKEMTFDRMMEAIDLIPYEAEFRRDLDGDAPPVHLVAECIQRAPRLTSVVFAYDLGADAEPIVEAIKTKRALHDIGFKRCKINMDVVLPILQRQETREIWLNQCEDLDTEDYLKIVQQADHVQSITIYDDKMCDADVKCIIDYLVRATVYDQVGDYYFMIELFPGRVTLPMVRYFTVMSRLVYMEKCYIFYDEDEATDKLIDDQELLPWDYMSGYRCMHAFLGCDRDKPLDKTKPYGVVRRLPGDRSVAVRVLKMLLG